MCETLVVIICVYIIFCIINFIWLTVYCRVEAKVESIQKKNHNQNIEKQSAEVIVQNPQKRGIKQLIKDIYKELDHYMYGWMRYWIMRVSRFPSNRIRNFLYKNVFNMKISKETVISAGCEIRSPWNITLGKCTVAGNCILDGRSGIIIEDNAVLGMNVHIWTQEHDVNSPTFAVNDEHRGCVIIKKRAWVCSDTTILPNTVIGEGAVVAAKGCVTKDCEPFTIYGGVPAKKIGVRNQELIYELSGKPHWHFN